MDNETQVGGDQKRDYASGVPAFANDTPMRFTMRELHRQLTDARFWMGMAAVILILVVTGPFGTSDSLSFPARLGYWAITAFATYVACLAGSIWGTLRLSAWNIPLPMARMLAAIPAGGVVFVIVTLINLSAGFTNPPNIAALLVQCVVLAVAINAIFMVFDAGFSKPETVVPVVASNIVLDRLSREKRGEVIRIETQDHYLDVTTVKGAELILMRMSDAVVALGSQGVQTHRSHWVARRHVTGSSRENNRWVLSLSDGGTAPVSRAYVQSLRDEGLLPPAR
jgi:hypothetical protein